MIGALLKQQPTGRQWGDKQPETTGQGTINGLKLRVTANDAWEGPCDPGERGQYHRCWWVDVT